jgi:hypothetical protein
MERQNATPDMDLALRGVLAVALLLAVLAATGAPAEAATRIYRTVDADGNVVFTDVPPRPGEPGEPVELQQGSDFTPPEPATNPSPLVRLEDWLGENDDDGEAAPASYATLRILSPADDEGLRDNAGNVMVVAEIDPALQTGHTLQLYLDGTLTQSIRSGRTFQLTNVDRGSHSLELRVVDAGGATLMASEAHSFHLQRRSVLSQPSGGRN